MLLKKLSTVILLAALLASCGTSKKTTTSESGSKADTAQKKVPEPAVYRAANTITNLIYDTKAEVRFDWSKKWMYGKATLTFKPKFYPVNHLDLNARGMEIKEVSLIENGSHTPLKYVYENDSIKIELNRTYTRTEQYVVYIDYISKPDEMKNIGGSSAITSDKGLYFINADGSIKNKPQQIWTQGETQSTSVWLPTIDSPNQRMYQTLSITVDTAYVTLSNGTMIAQKDNGNGTRTDTWKMSLPHAPYLAMMAIGKFSIVKDHWRDMPVDYYVEPTYASEAKAIFGKTPEMIEFFSTKLGVDYAWEKYSQIIVRDYVSGAMENTTATLHGEFLNATAREMIDGDNESVISHELFHQWFGDLVTCESWANISLNESFATYGEYLWDEYKYGRDQADYGGQNDLNNYMLSAGKKKANLIRFDYDDKEDVFDGISYQKGGRILHMLRKYVGDDAFFLSLKNYLTDNKFTAAEAQQLRLEFEKTTGEDLNWFWNQWYYNAGHPVLEINYAYDDTAHKVKVMVEQKQDFEKFPLFKLPVAIDIYADGKVTRQKVTINKAKETFSFDAATKPDLVNFDGEKMLLCKKNDNHTTAEWIYMYNHAPLYLDRREALDKCKSAKPGTPEAKVLMAALNDNFYVLRRTAISSIGTLAKDAATKQDVKNSLIQLAKSDKKAAVRVSAINALAKNYKDDDLKPLYQNALKDSSYNVIESAVTALVKRDSVEGLKISHQFESDADGHIKSMAAGVYADYGGDNNATFMNDAMKNAKDDEQYNMLDSYGSWLKRCSPQVQKNGTAVVIDYARNASSKWVRFNAHRILKEQSGDLEKKISDAKDEIAQGKKGGKSEAEFLTVQKKADDLKKQKETLDATITDIEKNEKDEMIRKLYGNKAHVEFGDGE